jgi:hypothetical protein
LEDIVDLLEEVRGSGQKKGVATKLWVGIAQFPESRRGTGKFAGNLGPPVRFSLKLCPKWADANLLIFFQLACENNITAETGPSHAIV